VSKIGKIDDPLDASFEAWPEESASEAGDVALTVVGVFSEIAGVFGGVHEHFRVRSRFARVNYLLNGVRLGIAQLESRVVQQASELAEVRTRISALEFREATETAAEEAVRAVNIEKIDQFSSILVGSVDPGISQDSLTDASTLIRDVARLSSTDLQILRHLVEAYGSLFAIYPNMHDPNVFTEKIQDFKDAVSRSGLHPEEFQSVCERLRGFGLAAEVLRNTSRMSPSDYCYRPTRRGLKLLRLLGNSVGRNESSNSSTGTESQATIVHRVKTAIETAVSAIDYWTPKVANIVSSTQLPPSNLLDFADVSSNLDQARLLSGNVADLMAGGYDKLRQAKSEIEHARQWKPVPGGIRTRPPGDPMPYLSGGRNLFMEAKRLVLAEISKVDGT
jgi:hypothetical protein